jgi:hypothetical protein
MTVKGWGSVRPPLGGVESLPASTGRESIRKRRAAILFITYTEKYLEANMKSM